MDDGAGVEMGRAMSCQLRSAAGSETDDDTVTQSPPLTALATFNIPADV